MEMGGKFSHKNHNSDRPWALVLVYSNSCGFCQSLMNDGKAINDWKQVMEDSDINGIADVVNIEKDEFNKVSDDLKVIEKQISGYPTILLFEKSSQKTVVFKGTREHENIKTWVHKYAKPAHKGGKGKKRGSRKIKKTRKQRKQK